MKPFFCFYGGKWRAAPHYPAPDHETIIEPFAGAAGYSTRYPERNIILCDLDPVIAALWDYLIHVPVSEVLALPIGIEHVDEVPGPPEARSLVGFWLNKGTTQPCKRPSAWMRQGIRPRSQWGVEIRQRIAEQVEGIRHWTIHEDSYDGLDNQDATWFIDPPYAASAGRRYRYDEVDFAALAEWCQELTGQVIVCEQTGADWLPFTDLGTFKSNPGARGKKYTREAIWTNRKP